MKKPLTGLELTGSSAKMVQVVRERHAWKLTRAVEVPFPIESVDISNKTENIMVAGQFLDTIREGLKSMDGGVSRMGVSLPNEIVKISLHSFDDLPRSRLKVEELIVWKERPLLPFPAEKAKTTYSVLEDTPGGKKRLLVALGSVDIIRDYELNLRKLRINPEIVQASSINHLNFYISHLPASGIHSFLGVFDDYFSFFVMEEGRVSFYRGKRRHSMYVRFLQEIAMTMQLFLNENPGKAVETLYVQSQVSLPPEFGRDVIQDFLFETRTIDENDLIGLDPSLFRDGEPASVGRYASAIGAAQSLAA